MSNKILVIIFFLLLYYIFSPSFVFANNNADPVNSTVSVSTTSIPADGSTTATIWVTVKDSFKNGLANDHITITSTYDPGLVINGGAIGAGSHTAAANGDGNVYFTVSSRDISPGTDIFTITDTSDNPPVYLGTVQIKFTPAPLAPNTGCPEKTPEGAPMLKSAVANGSGQITLTWTNVADPVSYYLVAYGTESKKYIYGNPNVGGQGTTSYTVGNLVNGAIYYFVVRAGNGCAPGSYSNELSAVAGGITTRQTDPTPTETLKSSSESVSEKNQSTESGTIEITPTPKPTNSPTPTPQTSAQTLVQGISNTKILPYIFTAIFVLGGVGAFAYWKHKKL